MKNILSSDPSPYLQQHKNNPVHWQTWNKDTLNLAKTQKKTNIIKHWLFKLPLVSCYGSREF